MRVLTRALSGLLGLIALCVASAGGAQTMQRVAVLTPSPTQWEPEPFLATLSKFGYRVKGNIEIDVYSADGRLDLLPELGERAVRTNPDVIVAVNSPGTRAAARATSRIPIVASIVADPVLLGFVKNIGRPEGNITGIANMATDITSKRIALLKEVIPSARRLALFMHPDEPIVAPQLRDIQATASALDIEYRAYPMRTRSDLRHAMQLATGWNAHAIVRLAGQGVALGADTGRLASERRLPSMLLQKRDLAAGGLMSYFADHRELWRRVAVYVDRILKGAAPRDLPFEMPTRFELVINLKAAQALGIVIPPPVLARADEVIE